MFFCDFLSRFGSFGVIVVHSMFIDLLIFLTFYVMSLVIDALHMPQVGRRRWATDEPPILSPEKPYVLEAKVRTGSPVGKMLANHVEVGYTVYISIHLYTICVAMLSFLFRISV